MKLQHVLALLIFGAGCNQQSTPSAAVPKPAPPTVAASPNPGDQIPASNGSHVSTANIERLESKHLPNLVRVTAGVISGGLPEGDDGFAELKEMGIKTVITVDGAKPDVATAEKHGLRYVHLPHGYDGVPEDRAKQLAKAVRDLPCPIYIHCHHGKHRSPAAAAVACLGAGLIGREEAAKVLKVAGTGENYLGLFQSVERARPLGKAALDQIPDDFPAIARLPAMAEAMVAIEHVHDRLKAIERAGWKTPADQPALVADHEALILREHFTEVLRMPELKDRPEGFRELTKEAVSLSQALEDGLKSTVDPETASKLFLAVSNNCKACHQQFRDRPRDAK